MCGIIGIVGKSEVASALYDGLTVLQHRGQDAAGIATVDGERLRLHKGAGLVRDVFQREDMLKLRGRVGIGHCRYPTAGSESLAEAQPLYVNSPYGIALGHNGNLINTESLRRQMFEDDRRHINTDSDSEILLNMLRARVADPGTPRAHAGPYLQGRRRRPFARARRLCRRVAAAGLRHRGVPRSAWHPPAHARRTRNGGRQGVRRRLRICQRSISWASGAVCAT